MPAAAVSGDQKMRSRSCFTSCFSSSAVYDPEESPGLPPEKAAGRSPEAFFWARASRHSKTVPLVEEITADEVGHVAEGREIKREVPPSVISPATICDEGMPGKLRKAERRCKFTGAKPLTQKPLSTCSNKRSNNQHSNKNHHLSSTIHKVNHRGPIQSRTRTKMINKNSPNSTRPAICSTTACPRLDMQIGLKLVAMMLVTILIGGKIFAVFITTLCFYFFSCRPITTNIINDVYLKNYEKVSFLFPIHGSTNVRSLNRPACWIPSPPRKWCAAAVQLTKPAKLLPLLYRQDEGSVATARFLLLHAATRRKGTSVAQVIERCLKIWFLRRSRDFPRGLHGCTSAPPKPFIVQSLIGLSGCINFFWNYELSHKEMKKVYSAASAFAHVVRAESVSEGFSGDALKLEGHTINGGKRGTLVRIEKKSTQNRMPREASLKGKLTTSVGNPVLEASVDCKGGCFEFGAIKRKIGNGDLPSAKRSIFKDERVNISNSPSNCESSQCTEAKKNNVNPRIIRPGSVRADNYIPSTTEPYDSIEDFTNRSFNGTNEMNFKHNKTARRALRFVEDDDGEQRRTPVHQVAAVPLLREYSGTFQSERKSHMQPESSRGSLQNASNSDMSIGFIGNVSSRVNERPINVTGNIEMMDSCYSASRLCNVEVNVLKYSADLLAGSNSVNQKKCITASPNGRAANNELETLDSPGNADKLVNIEALKHQVRGEIPKNNQFGDPCKLFGTSRFSCSPLISQKHKSSLEKSRAITKSNLSGLSFAENRSNVHFSAECYTEKDVSGRQRSDITRDATSADSAESKLTGSAMSMKHLIAAAQAKRREAHSHQLLDGSGTPGSSLASKCVRGRSPNLMSTMQTLPSRGDPSQKDEKWFQTSVPCELPSTSHQNFPVKQRKHEGYDHRPSTGNLQPSDSSSHSTETAVARDALEGMIETLSRTRDSIGRATRHAIDCAKYGIAKEVVELLIHKLEGEPSLSHRIDLFFLVDSITQCSHTQKGIAGASYVPIVQEALPRLLGAAAPAGASAQENRRQCLKVLRLWLERRILPEYFLRHCMDEIEVRNDGLNFEFSSRIPSCASQCVDDPIREVESLFVDQYGSNTTFLFPGILSPHDLEGDEDFPSSPCNGTADCSPHEVGGVSEVLLGSEGRPMEAQHHALEHVENEIEMEDALTSPDERSIGRGSSYSFAHPQEHRSFVESTRGYQNELLLLPVGSPPLPLDPPPTPPLPPSSPPPTPPPPSSPPPMPPPQSSPIVLSPSPPQLPSGVHGMQFTHQVSYSSQLLQQCGETIQQMPPYSAPPALKILNHPLPSIEMPSDHIYHGNSMCQHHLKQKYSHCPSSSEEQWMSHHGDANQDYSDAQNIGGRSPSCSSAPFVGDGCCRLNMARTAASTDFYHLQHYSAPSRASLPGDSFPNFTGIDFWRPT